MSTLKVILAVSKALLKPIGSLLKGLEDGRISAEERDALILEILAVIAEVLPQVLPQPKQ